MLNYQSVGLNLLLLSLDFMRGLSIDHFFGATVFLAAAGELRWASTPRWKLAYKDVLQHVLLYQHDINHDYGYLNNDCESILALASTN